MFFFGFHGFSWKKCDTFFPIYAMPATHVSFRFMVFEPSMWCRKRKKRLRPSNFITARGADGICGLAQSADLFRVRGLRDGG